ncbi:MAG: hypothetical protein V4506_19230 [Bacteroidota bacterium]
MRNTFICIVIILVIIVAWHFYSEDQNKKSKNTGVPSNYWDSPPIEGTLQTGGNSDPTSYYGDKDPNKWEPGATGLS